MKFLDFFSGIGGFRLGMEMAGHECVGHCEIDKYADISYRAMHKVKENEFYANDITRIEPGDLPQADVYCGGFPCQAFSIAGNRGGFADTRGTLFFEVMRLAVVRKPKYLFLENVKGLLSHDNGKTFGTIIQSLWECGYDAEWQVCNSKNHGVPQNRERIFIVGHFRDGSGFQVFPIGQDGGQVDVLQRPTTNTIKARYEGCGDRSYIVENQFHAQGIKQVGNLYTRENRENPNDGRIYDPSGLSPCLNRMDGGNRQPFIQIKEATQKGYAEATLEDNVNIGMPTSKTRRGRVGKEVCNTLTTMQSMVVVEQPTIIGGMQKNQARKKDGIVPCLTSSMGAGGGYVPMLWKNLTIRKLTPKECFRLQGFPDEYFVRAASVNSDSQLYKQAGNSVTVPVIHEIARRLK